MKKFYLEQPPPIGTPLWFRMTLVLILISSVYACLKINERTHATLRNLSLPK